MNRMLTSLIMITLCPALSAGISSAESGVVQNRDGASGRLSPLSDDIGIYSDPHGNLIIVTKPGTESPTGLRPHGETESENRSSFGTPQPPNNLTPAPVLPFHPNRALSPAPSPRNQPPAGGTGRFGR